MRVVSVQVGTPRPLAGKQSAVASAIVKHAVHGRVAVHEQNIAGDRQADLEAHGGRDKAVYAYPSEHYEHWRATYPERDFPWGAFGENLTLQGLLEDALCIGDVLQIGSVELRATQPRMPCYKLGLHLDLPDIVERFFTAGRPGIYFRVDKEGELGEGDSVRIIGRARDSLTIREVADLCYGLVHDPRRAQKAAALTTLGPEWHRLLRKRNQ